MKLFRRNEADRKLAGRHSVELLQQAMEASGVDEFFHFQSAPEPDGSRSHVFE
jgi:hypothetical protein